MLSVNKESFFFLLFVSLIFAHSTHAFLNIEELRQEKSDSGKLTGSTGIRLNDQRGNVNKTQVQWNTLNLIRNGKSSYIALASYRYGESLSRIDTREGDLHLRYTRTYSPLLQLEVFQQSEFNKFEDLNSRFLIGGGYRGSFVASDKQALSIGIGAFYEEEEIEDGSDPKNPRGNTYLSYVYSSDIFAVSSTLYYQPNLEKMSDSRVSFNIGVESKISKLFRQQIQYTISRDALPPVGIKRTDAQFTAGLSLHY